MNWMLKNSRGDRDAMLTFATGGFVITVCAIIASLVESISIGSTTIKIVSPDSTIITAFLGATLLSYVARRNKKDEYAFKEKELKAKQTEQEV